MMKTALSLSALLTTVSVTNSNRWSRSMLFPCRASSSLSSSRHVAAPKCRSVGSALEKRVLSEWKSAMSTDELRGGALNDDNGEEEGRKKSVPPRGGDSTSTLRHSSNSLSNNYTIESLTAAADNTVERGGSLDNRSEAVVDAKMDPMIKNAAEHHKGETRAEKRARKKALKAQLSHMKYAKKLKNRNHLNLSRKLVHAAFGLFFTALNHTVPRPIFLPFMSILTTTTLLMEMLRYRKHFGWMNDVLHFFLGSSLRKHEMEGKFTGSFYYFLGVTLTVWLFPRECASLGICQLALADPSASFFGRQTRHVYWSRIENGFFGVGRNKGILGFFGGALFCFPFNFRVLSIAKFGASGVPGGKSSIALASIALGLAGAFADLCVPTPALTMPKKICGVPMPLFHVDDNAVVPVVSGWACTKIFAYLGWPTHLDLAKYIIC